MKVSDLMSTNVRLCRLDDTLAHAARTMREADCGAIVVVDGDRNAVAMITDRDICLAAYATGEPLSRIRVSGACSHGIFTVYEDDTIEAARELMRREQVRRVPVVDRGGRPVGVLSTSDLVRHARKDASGEPAREEVLSTLAAVCRPGVVRTAPSTSIPH
jgi:CBS domain-containing protein